MAQLNPGDIITRDENPRYKIIELLGTGSFGAVYKVSDMAYNKSFALKVIGTDDDSKQCGNEEIAIYELLAANLRP